MSIITSHHGRSFPSFLDEYETQFNGINQYAYNNGAHRFGTANSFALSCWVTIPASTSGQRIITCTDGSVSKGYSLSLSAGPVIRFDMANAGYSAGTFIRIESGILVPGEKYHIFSAYQGGPDRPGPREGALDLRLIINGVSVGTGTGTILSAFTNTSPFNVGTFNNGNGLFFDSRINEISVYEGFKDLAFAQNIYNGGEPADRSADADILSWYRMGDGDTPPILLDNIGANHLTMVNGPTIVGV